LLNHAKIANFAFRELSSRLLSQNSLKKKKQAYQGPTNRVPMGQNKKKNEGRQRQEVNFCRPLGWVQEGDFRQNRALACVCFDGQNSMKTSKLAPAIVTRLDREVKFTPQAGSLPS
jgi:hypothetical protein